MRLFAAILFAAFAAFAARAEPVCVDGVCYPSAEMARAARAEAAAVQAERPNGTYRAAFGLQSTADFAAFLKGGNPPPSPLEGHSFAVIVLLVLLGGLAANLTPCVLPLVPVNLVLIGRGWRRGGAYALGIALAYGALGLVAALGGVAFGAWAAHPLFNGAVACVFLFLALVMADVVAMPKLRFPRGSSAGGAASGAAASAGLWKPFALGLGAAGVASACVEPILVATLLFTAECFAAGRFAALALPFVLGLGMGLPYPLAAAGFAVLPRPGAWMVWVKRGFAAVFALMAVWYGAQVVRTVRLRAAGPVAAERGAAATPVAGKPRLWIVGAPWCRNCAVMARTVLADPEIARLLAGFDVRHVEIASFDDLRRHPELSNVRIHGLPAYVIAGGKGQP